MKTFLQTVSSVTFYLSFCLIIFLSCLHLCFLNHFEIIRFFCWNTTEKIKTWKEFFGRQSLSTQTAKPFSKTLPGYIPVFALSNLAVGIFIPREPIYSILRYFFISRGLSWLILAFLTSQNVLDCKSFQNLLSLVPFLPRKNNLNWFSIQKSYFVGNYLGFRVLIIVFIWSYCSPT